MSDVRPPTKLTTIDTLTDLSPRALAAERIARQTDNFDPGPGWDGPSLGVLPGSGQRPNGTPPEREWTTPRPLAAPLAKSCPVELLPSVIGDFVTGSAEETQVPVDLVAIVVLGVCAGITARIDVATSRQEEPATLYTLGLAESGERKSSVVSSATAPLVAIDEYLRTDSSIVTRYDKALAAHKYAEQRVAAAEAAVKKVPMDASKEDRDRARTQLEEAFSDLRDSPRPAYGRILVDNTTPEGLTRRLQQNAIAGIGEVAAIVTAESSLGTVLGVQYGKGTTSDPVVLLKAHAGEGHAEDRQGREERTLRSMRVAIAMAVQPMAVRPLFENAELTEKGLTARFAWVWPQSVVGYRDAKPARMPDPIRDRYTSALYALGVSIVNLTETPKLKLSAAAEAHITEMQNNIEPRLRPEGDLAGLRSWASKAHGLAVRLAGIFHLVENGPRSWTSEVSALTAQNAVTLVMEWLLPHSLRVHREIGADPLLETARQIHAWVRRNNHESFTRAEAYRDLRKGAGWRDSSEAEPALQLLVEFGHLQRDETPGVGSWSSDRWPVRCESSNPEKRHEIHGIPLGRGVIAISWRKSGNRNRETGRIAQHRHGRDVPMTAVDLLHELRRRGFTAQLHDNGLIQIRPKPDPELAESLRSHRDEVVTVLRAACRRCGEPEAEPSYWAEHIRLCTPCMTLVAATFELVAAWPTVPLRCGSGWGTPTPCDAPAAMVVRAEREDRFGDFHACTECAMKSPQFPWQPLPGTTP